jgi:hypothetical protein
MNRPEPTYVVPGTEASTRKMLLVSCAFPPDPSVGSLRWQKMTGHGARRGWSFDVIMIDPRDIAAPDSRRLADLPPGTRAFGVRIPRSWRPIDVVLIPLRWARRRVGGTATRGPPVAAEQRRPSPRGVVRKLWRRRLTRLDFSLSALWVRRAAALGRLLVRQEQYACVVSSGPPNMAHEAARRIAREAGLPFVMDLRDPWFAREAVPEGLDAESWLRIVGGLERACVQDAVLVVVNTELVEEAMRARYPDLGGGLITVRNGADEDPLPTSAPRDRFVIAFAGSLYVGRDPRNLFHAVARVVRDLALTPRDLGVEFMGDGTYGGQPLTEIAAETGIGAFFVAHGAQPRARAQEFLARASIVVSLPQYVAAALPAKIFEYVRYDAWLLVLTVPGTASARALAGSAADVVTPEDVAGIADVIGRHYQEFRAGGRPPAINVDGRFDRSVQAMRFYDRLEAALAVDP